MASKEAPRDLSQFADEVGVDIIRGIVTSRKIAKAARVPEDFIEEIRPGMLLYHKPEIPMSLMESFRNSRLGLVVFLPSRLIQKS